MPAIVGMGGQGKYTANVTTTSELDGVDMDLVFTICSRSHLERKVGKNGWWREI